MHLSEFIQLRPFLFHLTARSNVGRILRLGVLQPATLLLKVAGMESQDCQHRPESLIVSVDGDVVHLRDQRPLYERNVLLQSGWKFGDFLRCLNSRVFFWPGDGAGPIPIGIRHFKSYANDDCVILQVPTATLIKGNPDPEFCRFNSGSPRCNNGKPSPRGPGTFLNAAQFAHTPGEVKEVTFTSEVRLSKSDVAVTSVADWT